MEFLCAGANSNQAELDTSLFVAIAELAKAERLMRHTIVSSVELARDSDGICEAILLVRHLSHDIAPVENGLGAHTHAAWDLVANILPSEVPLGNEV